MKDINEDICENIAILKNDFCAFTRSFFEIRTGRSFELSSPISRRSHYLEMFDMLNKVAKCEIQFLVINLPPRYGKTEICIHFAAWLMANNPFSNIIYTSYSHSLAKKQTQTIRQIIQLPYYKRMFNVELSQESSAKDNFETSVGGSVYGVGAQGTITGRGAGIKGFDGTGGCILIDDIHKPDEATSDTIREGTKEWYYNTLISRLNNPKKTPVIYIGQRVHEDDLASHLIKGDNYCSLVIPALDSHNNAIHPSMHNTADLLKMQERSPYEFSAQYQQNPQPAGGGLFKPDWFVLMDDNPDIICTFITADTAETEKNYNDATVFSFWGIYQIKINEILTEEYGLHWIDCWEIRVEPKDLYSEFLQFYSNCMRFKEKPKFAVVEKKSSGVTLLSVLKEMQGLRAFHIERTKAKVDRFMEAQHYVASKFISLPRYGKHTSLCIEHCRKITANNSHRFDDICDTMYDAIKVALIDKMAMTYSDNKPKRDNIAKQIMSPLSKLLTTKNRTYGNSTQTPRPF